MSFCMPQIDEITVKKDEQQQVVISMEEYKELLMIKGRYEELKQQSLYKPVLNRDFDLSKVTL